MTLSDTQLRLIDGWQRDFPLDPSPYAQIAMGLGVSELTVLGMLSELSRTGVLSRVGAVVAPNTAGASTLAAMAVPSDRLEDVAEQVNVEECVNHNYEREHHFNLWFVLTGQDRRAIDRAIERIENKTGLDVLDLPLHTAYHIDLGFPLSGQQNGKCTFRPRCNGAKVCAEIGNEDLVLLQALENGLPIGPRPYAEIAVRIGISEEKVIERLHRLVESGVIKRLGLVVRHRELGYISNAMVVWDIDDENVDEIGKKFAKYLFVTLCYRRPRHRPQWPYNLFCMIHGRDRETVLNQIKELSAQANHPPMDVLFSQRRFKQRGARLSVA
jgi:DNA-binding Lrp family transcriptional regulator